MFRDIDISAEDRDGQPILLGWVGIDPMAEDDIDSSRKFLDMAAPTVEFGMLVDTEAIRFFRRDEPSGFVARLATPEVFAHYTDHFARANAHRYSRSMLRDTIATLATSWLRDLAFRWKGGEPPGLAEVTRIGLMGRLDDGLAVDEGLMRDRSLS